MPPSRPVPKINIDEQKTRMAIMNLIDNAIFYSPRGHVKVYLNSDDHDVIFKVVDDGIGVPQNQKAKLFTKFSRADNARKERPDGTGIGLFLVKRVAQDQGGKVIFESQEGKGSTFGFRLPITKSQAAAKTRPLPDPSATSLPTEQKQPRPVAQKLETKKQPPTLAPLPPRINEPQRQGVKKERYVIYE